jgi:hypothetical protein
MAAIRDSLSCRETQIGRVLQSFIESSFTGCSICSEATADPLVSVVISRHGPSLPHHDPAKRSVSDRQFYSDSNSTGQLFVWARAFTRSTSASIPRPRTRNARSAGKSGLATSRSRSAATPAGARPMLILPATASRFCGPPTTSISAASISPIPMATRSKIYYELPHVLELFFGGSAERGPESAEGTRTCLIH